jgi:hypothetical protein
MFLDFAPAWQQQCLQISTIMSPSSQLGSLAPLASIGALVKATDLSGGPWIGGKAINLKGLLSDCECSANMGCRLGATAP